MNSRMLYTSLLGLPEDLEEPTLYQLLGITPEEATPERVAEALEERKQYARSNVPDPRLIPAVMVLETELQQAADVLSDPTKRTAYDAKHKIGRPAPEPIDREARKNKLRRFIREQVKELSAPDKTMTAANKEELARRLSAKGIAQKTIDHVLGQIPDASKDKEPSGGAVTDFFEQAVGMALQKGILNDEDRGRFIEMGKSFGVDEETAMKIIDSKIAQRPEEAPPEEIREPVPAEQTVEKPPEEKKPAPTAPAPSREESLTAFETRLREICPSGRLDGAQRKTLTQAMKELRVSRDDAMGIIKKVRKEYDAAQARETAPPEPAPEPPAEEAPPAIEPTPEPEAAREPTAEPESAPVEAPEKTDAPAVAEQAPEPTADQVVSAPEAAPPHPRRRKRPLRILGVKLKLEMIIPVLVVILFVLFIWLFTKYFVGD